MRLQLAAANKKLPHHRTGLPDAQSEPLAGRIIRRIFARFPRLRELFCRIAPEPQPGRQDASTSNDSLFRDIFAVMTCGVVVLDARGMVRVMNDAARRMLGAGLEGSRWSIVIQRCFVASKDDATEVMLKTGRQVVVATCGMGGGAGQMVQLFDVTADRLLRKQEELLARSIVMNKLLACMAHQIRTPLAAALLYLSRISGPDAQIQIRERIRTSLQHLEDLVNDMMKFAHSGTLEKSPVEPEDLFRDLSCVVEPLIAGAGCRFNIVNDAWYSSIMANREALLCALENLIMNAIDACGADGVITLYAAPAGAGRIEILVRDNGKGIAAADRERIFEQFYTDKPRGTGLGLSIVRSVAAAHGSEVTLESEPGKGATFGIMLQQAECGARAAEPAQALSLTA